MNSSARERCNCESILCRVCKGKGCTNYAGTRRALYIGRMCDRCAEMMPQEYMIKEDRKGDDKGNV